MIALVLLAFSHWSSCVPIWTKNPLTGKFYDVCSYYWVNDPEPNRPDGEMAIGPSGTAWSPGENVLLPKRTAEEIRGWGVTTVPYVDFETERPVPQTWVDDEALWFVPPRGAWGQPDAVITTAVSPPRSHCYAPGDTLEPNEKPCVTIEVQP